MRCLPRNESSPREPLVRGVKVGFINLKAIVVVLATSQAGGRLHHIHEALDRYRLPHIFLLREGGRLRGGGGQLSARADTSKS